VRPKIVALAALAMAGIGAGCGREEEPDLVNGKTLFVQKCGSCHVLDRAGTRGIQGPNLDDAFAQARADGIDEDTVEGVVSRQIGNVRRNSIMPANLVKGADKSDVSAYVAMVAAQPGQDEGRLAQAGKPRVSRRPVRARNGTLDIDADPSGALAFTAVNAVAPAGSIQLVMDNESSVQHNIAVAGGGVDEKGAVVGQGGKSEVSVSLRAGKYEFLCTVPGHAYGGMKGTLTVE
jgi:mono/diheme cytochrome c family protein/plastocyanin